MYPNEVALVRSICSMTKMIKLMVGEGYDKFSHPSPQTCSIVYDTSRLNMNAWATWAVYKHFVKNDGDRWILMHFELKGLLHNIPLSSLTSHIESAEYVVYVYGVYGHWSMATRSGPGGLADSRAWRRLLRAPAVLHWGLNDDSVESHCSHHHLE